MKSCFASAATAAVLVATLCAPLGTMAFRARRPSSLPTLTGAESSTDVERPPPSIPASEPPASAFVQTDASLALAEEDEEAEAAAGVPVVLSGASSTPPGAASTEGFAGVVFAIPGSAPQAHAQASSRTSLLPAAAPPRVQQPWRGGVGDFQRAAFDAALSKIETGETEQQHQQQSGRVEVFTVPSHVVSHRDSRGAATVTPRSDIVSLSAARNRTASSNKTLVTTKTAVATLPPRPAPDLRQIADHIENAAGTDLCDPVCRKGRGVCANKVCFCKEPYTGISCEKTLNNVGTRIPWHIVLSICICGVVLGAFVAVLIYRFLSETQKKLQSFGEEQPQGRETWKPSAAPVMPKRGAQTWSPIVEEQPQKVPMIA